MAQRWNGGEPRKGSGQLLLDREKNGAFRRGETVSVENEELRQAAGRRRNSLGDKRHVALGTWPANTDERRARGTAGHRHDKPGARSGSRTDVYKIRLQVIKWNEKPARHAQQ
jgi:hypothetical protein